YEHQRIKTKDFPLFRAESSFTDDTVLTVAVAAAILSGTPSLTAIRDYGRRYPQAGYGKTFRSWLLQQVDGEGKVVLVAYKCYSRKRPKASRCRLFRKYLSSSFDPLMYIFGKMVAGDDTVCLNRSSKRVAAVFIAGSATLCQTGKEQEHEISDNHYAQFVTAVARKSPGLRYGDGTTER
ncbi:MAG: hypothetical protein P8X63_12990, partial [Desulfuromonadaceae bacterium]